MTPCSGTLSHRLRANRGLEALWSLRKVGVTWEAELRYHSESGIEAQLLRQGELVIGRRFETRALAGQWAEEERKALQMRTQPTD